MLSKAEPSLILRVEESQSLGRDGEAYFTTVIHNYLLMLKLRKEILNFGIHGNIHGHRNVKPDPSAQSPAILLLLCSPPFWFYHRLPSFYQLLHNSQGTLVPSLSNLSVLHPHPPAFQMVVSFLSPMLTTKEQVWV